MSEMWYLGARSNTVRKRRHAYLASAGGMAAARQLSLLLLCIILTVGPRCCCAGSSTQQPSATTGKHGQPLARQRPGATNGSPPTDISVRTAQQQIEDLQRKVDRLQDSYCDQSSSHVSAVTGTAGLVVMASALLIAVLTVLIAVAGFFGVREFRQVQRRLSEAEEIRERLEQHVEVVESLETKMEDRLAGLAGRFELECQSLVEAAHNFSIATIAYKEGDNEKAIEYFQRTAKLQPQNAHVLCRIGRAYTNLGYVREALEYFHRALELDADCSEALRGLAATYRYNDHDKAVEYALRAAESSPDDGEAYDYLGLLYRDENNIEAAVAAHLRACAVGDRPDSHFFLALLYAHEGHWERAKLAMQTAVVMSQEERQHDRIRPLWFSVIKWGGFALERQYAKAWQVADEIRIRITTERVATAVLSHMEFLFAALGCPKRIDRYKKLFQEESPEKSCPVRRVGQTARPGPDGHRAVRLEADERTRA